MDPPHLPISSLRHCLSCTEDSLGSSFCTVPWLPQNWQQISQSWTRTYKSKQKGSLFCHLVVIFQQDQFPKLDYITRCFTSREKHNDRERKEKTFLVLVWINFDPNNHKITVSCYCKFLCLPVVFSAMRLLPGWGTYSILYVLLFYL